MSELEKRQKGIRYTVIGVVTAVVVILVGFTYKLTQPRILNLHELRSNGALLLETPRRMSDFALRDHHGETFDRERLKGQWTLAFFGFTNCPDSCPTALAALAKMYRELDVDEQQQIQVLLVSLDPERDTQQVLADYVPYFHADFIGVAGDPYVTLKLATELNVPYAKVPSAKTAQAKAPQSDSGDYSVEHTGNILVINPMGDYHGILRPPFEEGSMRVAWRSIKYHFEN